MNIIILGAGKVGSYLTSGLAEEGHDILVIDHDKDVLDKLLASNDVMGIVGDGRDPEVLMDADVSSCDLFIAITLSDDVNLIASTIAKKLGAKNIIIRLRESQYINQKEIIEEITSASRIINPEMIAAKDIQRALKYSHALNVESFFRDQAIMMELVISEGSSLVGSKISDLNAYSAEYHTLIGIVNNNGKVYIPHGSYVLEQGEKIYIIGAKEGADRFYKKEVLDRIEIKNVLIIRDYSKKDIDILSLVENIQREDLSPVEEAKAYKKLVDDFSMTQEEIAKIMAKSRSYIANTIRLLNLNEKELDALTNKQISSSQARTLLYIKDDDKRKEALDGFISNKLNIRQAENLSEKNKTKKAKKTKKKDGLSDIDKILLEDYEEKFMDKVGSKVKIDKSGQIYNRFYL